MAKLVEKMDDTFDTGFTLEEYAGMWLDRIQDDLFENQGIDDDKQTVLVLKAIAQRFTNRV